MSKSGDTDVTAATRTTRPCVGDISRTGTEYACHSMSLGERAMGDKFKAGVELRIKRSNDAREHGLDQSWKKNVSLLVYPLNRKCWYSSILNQPNGQSINEDHTNNIISDSALLSCRHSPSAILSRALLPPLALVVSGSSATP